MANATITIRVDSRWALGWVRAVRLLSPILAPILGRDRTYRLGAWGLRLLRMNHGRGWYFYRPPEGGA